ncbi:MAG: GAF domain-containing protein [Deltaproteobacteria bacterium]|nr:GAF domain-containing protein [Deltaproteobacteria bacterium]
MSLERRLEKLTAILDVAKAMTVERDLDALLGLILREAKKTIDADRCTIFVLDPDKGILWSRIAQGLSTQEIRLPVGQGIGGWVAEHDEVLNIPDAYEDDRFNRAVDVATGYQTRSILCAPMRGAAGEVVGVIQALNRADGNPFDDEDEELLLALGGQAGAAIQNALLNEEIERLFEGFVKASVVAIESRDPTTSGHSERVALLTCGLAEVVDRADDGPYQKTLISVAEMREIRYASLLHDFGKVGVREHVLVKANKLQPYELECLESRFQMARMGIERDHFRKLAALRETAEGPADDLPMKKDLHRQLAELEDFWAFVLQCNRPTVLEEGGFERLQEIAQAQVPGPEGPLDLLTAKDVELLSIPRGSLSAEERSEIESHVTHTFRFLTKIPWTRELKGVPQIAYAHHEKLDGRGYPRGLDEKQIPLGSRMMTIADIYDALTAQDRPYKKAMPHERAMDILASDAKRGLLDEELLRLFIEADVAKRFLSSH